jgi:5-aminolevulinate synthase
MFNYQQFFSTQLQQLQKQNLYRYFLPVQKSAAHFPAFYFTNNKGIKKQAINWCSNDYLGMSTHELLIAKQSFVAHQSGTGSGGTRNISGTTIHHIQLEQTLANWHKKEAALIFTSAYQANVTTLQTLGKQIPGLIFFSDEKNHASIIEGIKGCKNEKKIFAHNNLQQLEILLQTADIHAPKLIVFESVYSMNGTISNIPAIVALAKKYNALTYVDEVHGVGLYGPTGAGITEQQQIQQQVDIINGTLSKAIGVFGGYIAANNHVVDFVRSFGSGFIFTTSLPPAIAATSTKSIELIKADSSIRKTLFTNVALLHEVFTSNNIPFVETHSHITIVPIGNEQLCKQIADNLLHNYGIYVQPINYPTVAKNEACLRIIATAKHVTKHIYHLAASLQKVLLSNENSQQVVSSKVQLQTAY